MIIAQKVAERGGDWIDCTQGWNGATDQHSVTTYISVGYGVWFHNVGVGKDQERENV